MVLAVLIALTVWGCYPKRIGPPGPDGKRLTWAEMNLQQRRNHMQKVILPRTAAVFSDWRPERYADVDCTLCHGPQANAGIHDMPTDHLPRLSGDVFLGPEFEKYPQTTRLKLDKLVPAMAEGLGVKSFSIVTRRGFGCYSCHLGPDGPLFGN